MGNLDYDQASSHVRISQNLNEAVSNYNNLGLQMARAREAVIQLAQAYNRGHASLLSAFGRVHNQAQDAPQLGPNDSIFLDPAIEAIDPGLFQSSQDASEEAPEDQQVEFLLNSQGGFIQEEEPS